MGFCVNNDLIWIKSNYFFWRNQEKKPVNFQIVFCGEIKNYWRNITFWTYHPHHLFCDSQPKIPTSANLHLQKKKWNALYKKHTQVNIPNLSRGWKKHSSYRPSFYKCCPPLPLTILLCQCLFFLPSFFFRPSFLWNMSLCSFFS